MEVLGQSLHGQTCQSNLELSGWSGSMARDIRSLGRSSFMQVASALVCQRAAVQELFWSLSICTSSPNKHSPEWSVLRPGTIGSEVKKRQRSSRLASSSLRKTDIMQAGWLDGSQLAAIYELRLGSRWHRHANRTTTRFAFESLVQILVQTRMGLGVAT